jgi:hypothetical protein
MQMEVKAVKTSHNTRAKRLLGTRGGTRKELQEELDYMIQVETQTTRAVVEATRREFQTQLKKLKLGPSAGLVKEWELAQTWRLIDPMVCVLMGIPDSR